MAFGVIIIFTKRKIYAYIAIKINLLPRRCKLK